MKPSLKAEHELVPIGEDSSFAVREFKLQRFTSPWHLHSEYELTFIVKGDGKRFVGDSVSRFHKGDLVLLGSTLPHYWCSDKTDRKCHSIVIQFKENCLGDNFFKKPEMKQIRRLLGRCARGMKFSGKTRDIVAVKIQAIRTFAGIQRVQEFLSILDLLARSKEYRFLASEGFPETTGAWHDERIGRTCQYVFDHLAECISLDNIARTAGMSPEAFCRFFKKTTGQTLFSFINQIRIGHACALLIDSAMTISEICYASGFNNLSNFNRRFKVIKGMSPRKFRNQFQN